MTSENARRTHAQLEGEVVRTDAEGARPQGARNARRLVEELAFGGIILGALDVGDLLRASRGYSVVLAAHVD